MYFITPTYSIAFIPKAGCSTIARSVIRSFQPSDELTAISGHYPDGRSHEDWMFQWLAKKEKNPSKQVLAFIRDPVSRFLSAMSQLRLEDIEECMSLLESGDEKIFPKGRVVTMKNNPHFIPQISWMTTTAKLYRFPDHLDEGAVEVGFQLPLPVINAARRPKPVPSQPQIDRILEYYYEDMSLYQSISQPGIVTGMVAQRNYEIPTRFGQSIMDGFTGQP